MKIYLVVFRGYYLSGLLFTSLLRRVDHVLVDEGSLYIITALLLPSLTESWSLCRSIPLQGGLSGNVATNWESFFLNGKKVLSNLISVGNTFQRRAPNRAKDPS